MIRLSTKLIWYYYYFWRHCRDKIGWCSITLMYQHNSRRGLRKIERKKTGTGEKEKENEKKIDKTQDQGKNEIEIPIQNPTLKYILK